MANPRFDRFAVFRSLEVRPFARIPSLPLLIEQRLAAKCVSRIITNLCVFDVDRVQGTLTLIELAPGVSVEDIKKNTEAEFIVPAKIGSMVD